VRPEAARFNRSAVCCSVRWVAGQGSQITQGVPPSRFDAPESRGVAPDRDTFVLREAKHKVPVARTVTVKKQKRRTKDYQSCVAVVRQRRTSNEAPPPVCVPDPAAQRQC